MNEIRAKMIHGKKECKMCRGCLLGGAEGETKGLCWEKTALLKTHRDHDR